MKINVISPWYPDSTSVYSGVFVEKQVQAVRMLGAEVTVEVPTLFPAPPERIPRAVVDGIRALARNDIEAVFPSKDSSTWIPTPVRSASGFVGRAESFKSFLSLKREFAPVNADVTHAHLGVPSGWAAMELGDSPLVVSEHQSTLKEVFSEPKAKEMYRQVLASADAFICVSPLLRDDLTDTFGEAATNDIKIVPNVVDLEDIPFSWNEMCDFRNWIYVGSMASHKGFPLLLESFAVYRREVEPDATLTVIGGGPLKEWARRFASSKGITRSVTLHGPTPHSDLGPLLNAADLMVHLSPLETFGIASLEGLGAGLPVISLRNGGADTAWGDLEQIAGCILPTTADSEEVVAAVVGLRDGPGRLDLTRVRKEIERRYSFETIGEQLLSIYGRSLK